MAASLVQLEPSHHRGAARVAADAFMDDPGWLAVAPRRERARWNFIYRTCLGSIRGTARWGGPSWCVVDGVEVVALLTGVAPSRWPPPPVRSALLMAPGPLLAGPPTLARSLRAQQVVGRVHPRYPHFLVSLLVVAPDRHRQGLGRLLMRTALAAADADGVPAYLWTGKPDNVPYYASHGFEVIHEEPVCGAPNWFMERELPHTAASA